MFELSWRWLELLSFKGDVFDIWTVFDNLKLFNCIFWSGKHYSTYCPFSGKSKEAEIKRINKELANIRSKFKGDKALDGYSKKKYVCKLLFIFLLGHDIDFGHMEAVNLLSSNKYTEKQIVSLCSFYSII